MNREEIEKTLLGRHTLEYVYPSVTHPFDSDKEAFAIRMDGIFYLFLEDDNDGYRSSLGDILVSHILVSHTDDYYSGATSIGRVVEVTNEKSGRCGSADYFQFRDVKTLKVGLELGTDNVDDYYPSFIKHYNAEAFNGDSAVCDKCGH